MTFLQMHYRDKFLSRIKDAFKRKGLLPDEE